MIKGAIPTVVSGFHTYHASPGNHTYFHAQIPYMSRHTQAHTHSRVSAALLRREELCLSCVKTDNVVTHPLPQLYNLV